MWAVKDVRVFSVDVSTVWSPTLFSTGKVGSRFEYTRSHDEQKRIIRKKSKGRYYIFS